MGLVGIPKSASGLVSYNGSTAFSSTIGGVSSAISTGVGVGGST